MTRQQLPDDVQLAVDLVRRARPGGDLLDQAMAEVRETRQEAGGRWPTFMRRPAFAGVAGFGAVVTTVVVIAVAGIPGLRPPAGGSPTPRSTLTASAATSPTATAVHVAPVPLDQLPAAGVIEQQVPLPNGTHPGSGDEDTIWLGDESSGVVTRVDARTGRISGTIPVNRATSDPYNLWPIVSDGSVWVAGRDDRALVRIDPVSMTVVDRYLIDAVPYAIAPLGGAVWLTDFDGGRVLKVNAADGSILASISVGAPTGIALTPTAVWVVTYTGQLLQLDPQSGSVIARDSLAADATEVHAFGGAIWISGIKGRRLERWDPELRRLDAWRDRVGGVAFLGDRPWVSVEGGLAVLDPRTLAMVGGVRMPGASTDQLVAAAGRLWAFGATATQTSLYVVRPAPS